MLPIKLTIEGINSFKSEQVIDFSKLTSGFFGIFGATGSGKSSILDALTLALYGRTPRAKGNGDFINISASVARVSLVFSLNLKHKEFMIERSFKRKKEGKTESSACLFEKIDNSFKVIAEGVYDCDAKIKKLIGLGFEEFSKVIALPQGQFADFLRATSSERTNLITNLFDLYGYGSALTESVKTKEKAANIALAQTRGELSTVSDASNEELDAITEEISGLDVTLRERESSINEVNAQIAKLEVIDLKVKELEKITAQRDELLERAQSIDEKRKQIEMIERALPLSKIIAEVDLSIIEEMKASDSVKAIRIEFDEVCKSYDALKTEVESINKTFPQKYDELLQKKAKLAQLINIEQEIMQKVSQIALFEEELKKLNSEISALLEKRELLEKNKNQLDSELERSNNYLKEIAVDPAVAAQIKKGVDLASQVEVIDKAAGNLSNLNFELLKNKAEYEKNKIDAESREGGDNYSLGLISGKLEETEGFLVKLGGEITRLMDMKGERKAIIESLERRFGGQNLYYIKNAIEKNEQTEKSLREKISSLEKDVNDLTLQLKLGESEIGDKEKSKAAVIEKISAFSSEVSEFNASVKSLASDENLSGEQMKTAAAIDALSKDKEQKNADLNALFNKRSGLEAEMKQKLVDSKRALERKVNLSSELEIKLGEAGLTKQEASTLSEREPYLPLLKKAVSDFDSEFALNNSLYDKLSRELENEQVDTEVVKTLRTKKTQNESEIREIQLKIGQKMAQKRQLEENVIKKEALQARLDEEEKRLGVIGELLKVLRGRALAEFVSSRYLERITERANLIGELLLDGKFTLKFSDGEFFVCDNLAGGEIRSVSTLSGGETFLISLALSLAISEAIANEASKNMEFFFLDEGFGTLDNELCDAVISALYKLQNKNLKFGVISHVDLLKERINNKIIVTKTESEGSKVKLDITL